MFRLIRYLLPFSERCMRNKYLMLCKLLCSEIPNIVSLCFSYEQVIFQTLKIQEKTFSVSPAVR